MLRLLKTLFKTFVYSVIILIAVTNVYYFIFKTKNGYDYNHIISSIFTGSLYLNLILVFMASPSLFLVNKIFLDNLPLRLFLYFAGPVLFITSVCLRKWESANSLFYLYAGLIFITVHIVYYFKLIKKPSDNQADSKNDIFL